MTTSLGGVISGSGGSWRDRIRKGTLVSPSGKRLEFQTTTLERSIELEGTVYKYPRFGGVFVQQTGTSERKYPILAIFSGDQCDLEATVFESMLMESGFSRLEHPYYGTLDSVVPLGTITRRDDLVNAANESIVEVTFYPSLASVYPGVQTTGRNEITQLAAQFRANAGSGFAELADIGSSLKKQGIVAALNNAIRQFGGAFESVSAVVSDVRSGVAGVQSVANTLIDNLVGKPLILAQQIVDLIHAPAHVVAGIESRLDSYSGMVDSILGSDDAYSGRFMRGELNTILSRETAANAFHCADLSAMSAVSGASLMMGVSSLFIRSRSQAASFIDQISALLDSVRSWRDAAFSDLQSVGVVGKFNSDSGLAFRALHALVMATRKFLIDLSFSLRPELAVVLGAERNVIELCSELYGSVANERLDLICSTNELSADEMLSIPAGRRIVYYP